METEIRARDAVRAAARPGATLAGLAAEYDRTLAGDGWELGPPTQHFDFHGQGQDVIELPWYAAEQPWGSTGDRELRAGTIVSYHPARAVAPAVGWPTGISDNLLVTDAGGEWLSGDWDHRWRTVAA
jgi:Xaa-Pro aminopeptidase